MIQNKVHSYKTIKHDSIKGKLPKTVSGVYILEQPHSEQIISELRIILIYFGLQLEIKSTITKEVNKYITARSGHAQKCTTKQVVKFLVGAKKVYKLIHLNITCSEK